MFKSFTKFWNRFAAFRGMCSEWLGANPYKIGGRDENGNPLNVQIDETKITGKRKYNRGRVYQEEWVFGGTLLNIYLFWNKLSGTYKASVKYNQNT